MNKWMNRWMDGWMDGWMVGCHDFEENTGVAHGELRLAVDNCQQKSSVKCIL